MWITDLSGYQGEDEEKNTHWLPDEYLLHQKCEEVCDPDYVILTNYLCCGMFPIHVN